MLPTGSIELKVRELKILNQPLSERRRAPFRIGIGKGKDNADSGRLDQGAVVFDSQAAKQLEAAAHQVQCGRLVLENKPAVFNSISEQHSTQRQF